MSNQWLNNLRRKMEDHTEDVPDEWWDDIRDELFCEDDKNKTIVFAVDNNEVDKKEEKPSGYNGRLLLYRIAGIAAALAFLFIIGKRLFDRANEEHLPKVIYSKHDSEINNSSIISSKNINTPGNSSGKQNEDYAISGETQSKNIFAKIYDKIIGKSQKKRNSDLAEKINNETIEKLKQSTQQVQKENEVTAENQSNVENRKDELPKNEAEEEIPLMNDQPKIVKRQSKKSWMLNVLTGSTSSSSAQQFPGYATMDGSPMSVDEVFTISDFHENPLTQVLLANQDEEVKAKVRHKVPVTLGVSLYYNIGKKWGIGTGVNYTKLSSELRSGSESNLIKSDQSVHYVGIPVQVNYNAVQKGRFTGYVTGGALVEKAVAGNVKTQYIVNDEVKEEKTEKLETKPTQISVNGGLGFQYKIINNIGIYAEPGVSYHFKDNSNLNTIYKEKPLNFNMKFGIRVLINN
ncbi:PorT family protein [Chryseobacterium daecheongense]|uniref:outer membrane beta-barrel protein n=1 Tax=Chryseobacterium daecheongense TaxID=192389 RepID=UPI001FD6E9A8|nr:outer membrane beta-barrel protein [Chryseobacterium daecheongense]UOU99251.1 PorT family protein [Chryseobacterium daecheongense]